VILLLLRHLDAQQQAHKIISRGLLTAANDLVRLVPLWVEQLTTKQTSLSSSDRMDFLLLPALTLARLAASLPLAIVTTVK
jgi:hypothetical protein